MEGVDNERLKVIITSPGGPGSSPGCKQGEQDGSTISVLLMGYGGEEDEGRREGGVHGGYY